METKLSIALSESLQEVKNMQELKRAKKKQESKDKNARPVEVHSSLQSKDDSRINSTKMRESTGDLHTSLRKSYFCFQSDHKQSFQGIINGYDEKPKKHPANQNARASEINTGHINKKQRFPIQVQKTRFKSEGTFEVKRENKIKSHCFEMEQFPPHKDSRTDSENKYHRNVQYGVKKNSQSVQKYDQRRKPLGYKGLMDISEKSGEEIAYILANTQTGFDELLSLKLNPDFIFLIVNILAKLTDADLVEIKSSILYEACRTEFLDQLTQYINSLPAEDKLTVNVNEFLLQLLKFYESILVLLPKTALDRFRKIFVHTDMAIKGIKQYHNIMPDPGLENHLHNLLDRLEEMRDKEELKKKNRDLPPNSFRDIDVFPTVDDLMQKKVSFVRPNIVSGSYNDVEHYLDVQFRLLREDFIAPFREGIQEYMRKTATENKNCIKRISNVRLYKKVKFKSPKLVSDRIGIAVNFDPNKTLKGIKWEQCKRFLFGSLLCFTKDNFRTIILATVVQRDLEELKQGIVVVELVEGTYLAQSIFTGSYVMLESEVYFEPYLHVLKGLQRMTDKDFPLKEYIVHVNCSDRQPKYFDNSHLMLNYKAKIKKPILNALPEDEQKCVEFPLMDYSQWPTAKEFGMDETQYKAFQSALTREFVVIQGPPGTGKTFLGLKIVNMLLENSKFWYEQTPILIICYTNHALDQFLEGIIPMTNKLVRIGGQSDSQRLAPFYLKERRKWLKRQRNEDMRERLCNAEIFQRYHLEKHYYLRIEALVKGIKVMQLDIEELGHYQGILSLCTLQVVMSDIHRTCFEQTLSDAPHHEHEIPGYNSTAQRDAAFADWLLHDDDNKQDWWGEESITDKDLKVDETDKEMEPQLLDAELRETKGKQVESILDFDIDIAIKGLCSHLKYAEDINRLVEQLNSLQEIIQMLENENDNSLKLQQLWMHRAQHDMLSKRLRRLKCRLNQLRSSQTIVPDKIKSCTKLWLLTLNERWMLYGYWLSELRMKLLENLRVEDQNYREKIKLYEELKFQDDLSIMRSSLIVGMTTSGAARLQTALQTLKPSIVIVEEAAEVLESHIVVSLTSHCQHLLLIGDHQQLKPNSAVYRLAKYFDFDVSLFERMVRNGMHCHILGVQHRMHPNICKLIVPTIYPALENHSSVMLYPPIKGISKNLYFVTHTNPDEEYGEALSHRNIHEAEFLIGLCRHLILQGYRPEEITIITTYSGQMFLLRKERQKHDLLRKVRMTVVDNFQGEENTIILMSLVRSNSEGNVGFLKIDNRVCVALSRARHAMYIVGNMQCLKKASTLWQKINDTLVKQEAIGTHLVLQCQVHPDQLLQVASAKDFCKSPEGGCGQKCGALLECGHYCKSICHTMDRAHEKVKCYEPCNRIVCELDHMCKKYCWENCGLCPVPVLRELPCGHTVELQCHFPFLKYACQIPVEKVLPECEHKTEAPCYLAPEKVECSFPCKDRLPCGHSCRLNCHVREDPDHLQYKCLKPCALNNAKCSENHPCGKYCYEECGNCTIVVTKLLPKCGHTRKMACYEDVSAVVCAKACKRTLGCGHPCPKKCGDICGGCIQAVTKVIPECGHKIKLRCCNSADRSMCQQKCERKLQCGHTCRASCASLCTPCEEMVESKIKAICGHIVKIPCYKQTLGLMPNAEELLSYCKAKCQTILKCEHLCSGNCSDCFQGRIHVECREKCGRTLICGHSCTTPCATSCPPCKKICNYRCVHSRCSKKCSEPCVPCTEPCVWKCEHLSCTKKCFELCDRPPCNVPCKKELKCGHPCIGFCGETCPPLCRICNKEEVTTVILGYEDEEDARFVYLEDCKHTIEAKGMEQWLQSVDAELALKMCPLCRVPITGTQRYMNIIKVVYEDIVKAKKLVFGARTKIANKREEIIQRLHIFENLHDRGPGIRSIIQESQHFIHIVMKVRDSLREVRSKRKNVLSHFDVETLGIQADILCEIAENTRKVESNFTTEWRTKLLGYMDSLLAILRAREHYLSQQEVEDFNSELLRFARVAQLCRILSAIHCATLAPELESSYKEAKELAFSIKLYTKDTDKRLCVLLADLKKAVGNITLNISDNERKEIIKAMGLPQGHWFKCPKGHVYAIADCGGAMEVSKCNECGTAIGGRNHSLLQNNQLASEMDGARYAAWSETANLQNYAWG